MAEQMVRHNAKDTLQQIAAYNIAMGDPKNSQVQEALRDLRARAEDKTTVEDREPMSLEDIRAAMSVLDFEEVA